MYKETTTVDSGYTQAGVHWSIERYNLRYATIFEVRVNGKATQFRKKDACYTHLQETKVQRFGRDVKGVYTPIMEASDGNKDGVGDNKLASSTNKDS